MMEQQQETSKSPDPRGSSGTTKFRRHRSSSFFDSTRQITITLGDNTSGEDGATRGGGTIVNRNPGDEMILSFSPNAWSSSSTTVVAPPGTTTTLPLLPFSDQGSGGGGGGGDSGVSGAISPGATTTTEGGRRITSVYDMSSTMNRLRSSLVGYIETSHTRHTVATTEEAIATKNPIEDDHGGHDKEKRKDVHHSCLLSRHSSDLIPVDDNAPHRRRPTINSRNRHHGYGNNNNTTAEMSKNNDSAAFGYGSIPSPLVNNPRSVMSQHQNASMKQQTTHGDIHHGKDGDDLRENSFPTAASTLLPDNNNNAEKQTQTQTQRLFDYYCCGRKNYWWRTNLQFAMGQIPAVIIMGLFHLMIGIPFGVSYFPIGWSGSSYPVSSSSLGDENTSSSSSSTDTTIHGPFPLPGKESLGIRMFLFSTMIGQIVFTYRSQFHNPIGLQMVENVPFCHALSIIVIKHVGYGTEALCTLVVMFGLSSIIVGFVFYVLGYYKLGRIIYFFPTHVLVGCIGGIGLFIAKTGIEVTINRSFNPFLSDFWNFSTQGQLWGVVLLFEIILRSLERITKHQYSLLGPIYFLFITPIFYLSLWVCNVSMSHANDVGYFFPSLDDNENNNESNNYDDSSFSLSSITSFFNDDTLWDYWRVVDFRTVSWKAILDSTPTLIALTLFSLIHVPINIPAFAISSNTEVDMNNELIAHGYSNALSGICGGLQNYMAYTQSVLYDKSRGTGKSSGIAVALLTALLYVIGPKIASYIPRCMAGTLLLHVGIDLFLEGVYDSYNKFDKLEYGGIWCIAIVMTLYGMDAAMMTGVIAAVSTYAVQNITYLTPIRGYMSATTLRSSQWNRNPQSQQILDSPTMGRSRILVVQLQGHLFFGNMAHLTESLQELVDGGGSSNKGDVNATTLAASSSPNWWIVILDLSLVLGIDSSAAQAILKLKNVMLTKYHIPLIFFVSGSRHGFPCEINLTKELSTLPALLHTTTSSNARENNSSTVINSSNKSAQRSIKKKKQKNPRKKVKDVESPAAVMVQSSNDMHFDTSSNLRRRKSNQGKGEEEEEESSVVVPCVDVDEETALLLARKDEKDDERAKIRSSSSSNDNEDGINSTLSHHTNPFSGSYVCESLDAALLFAENALIAKQDPNLLEDDLVDHHISIHDGGISSGTAATEQNPVGGGGAYPWLSYRGNAHPKSFSYKWDEDMSKEDEHEVALHYLTSLCRSHSVSFNNNKNRINVEDDMKDLFKHFERQVFYQDDYLWKQGDVSDSCKLIIRGDLIALLENEAGTTEYIACGNVIGEFGLVSGSTRMTSVQCISPRCIIYSLSKNIFDEPNILHPRLARYIDQLCVHYLGNRVQHVSNRIFETRCLPI